VTVASILLVVTLVATAATAGIALIVLAVTAMSAGVAVIVALVLRMTSDPAEDCDLPSPPTRLQRPRAARPRSQARPTHPVRNISTLGESMSTQRKDRRPSPIRRHAALATAVITALAIAAPVAEASAATPPADPPPASASAVATGPTLTGDVFNGPTAVVTSPSSAVGTVVGSA
jgi:hypothetical protein